MRRCQRWLIGGGSDNNRLWGNKLGAKKVLAVEDIKARLAERLKKILLEPDKASAQKLAYLVIK